MWPGAIKMGLHLSFGVFGEQPGAAGIYDITGCTATPPSWSWPLCGSAKPGAPSRRVWPHGAAWRRRANGRYVVVVDNDIDPINLKEVIWAMVTRADLKSSIDLVDSAGSPPLDSRLPPDKRASGGHTNS